MRAAYSAGAIAPLIEYGFSDTFEHVIGASAGAINGAYFIAADPDTYKTYTDDLTNKKFVNLLRKDKKVDIDYLVDQVIKHKRPIDLDRLRTAHAQLHTVLTNATTGKRHILSDHTTFENIYEEFRATAALPILYDKPVTIDGKEYVDGGISDLLPVDIAIRLGCTDIVVIMTRRIDSYRFDRRHTRLTKRLIKKLAHNQSPRIRDQLPTNERVLRANLRRLAHPTINIHIYVVEPSDESCLISLATTDKPKVEALAALGIHDMDEYLQRTM